MSAEEFSVTARWPSPPKPQTRLRSDFGVVSRAKTDRQKFQRAFAQNLLAPFSDVRKHVDTAAPTEEQAIGAAHHFYVHPDVIKRLLVRASCR